MKTMKTLLIAVLVCALLLALAGCRASTAGPETQAETEAQSETAPEPEKTPETEAQPEPAPAVTITDMAGRTVTLDEPATRVVALSAADCEILYAVGAGDTLVGRGEYCDYPAEVLAIPSVQSGYETNLEQILALEPQVLLMSTMAQPQEQVDALEKAGVRVVVSDAQDIEGVYTSVRMIGALMGKDAEAEKVVGDMQSALASLAAEAKGDGSKSVYFEVSPLQYGLWAAGKGTFMDEVAVMLGLKNIFDDVDGWGEVSEEQVIARDPDYIVTISMYFGEGPTPEEEIASRAGWGEVSAVRDGHIMSVQNNELSRPTPRIADGARMLYDFVYGDAADAAA